MGHYASEMDSNWSDHVDWTDRILKVRDKLKNYPLSKFKASDIPLLTVLYGYNGYRTLSETEVKYLENI